MYILTKNLGFRELKRLTQFIDYMIENEPNILCDTTIDYDMKFDEPYIVSEGNIIYSSELNLGFNAHNEIEKL